MEYNHLIYFHIESKLQYLKMVQIAEHVPNKQIWEKTLADFT